MFSQLNLEKFFLMFTIFVLVLSCENEEPLNPIQFEEMEAIIQGYADQNRAFPHLVSLDSTEVYPKSSYHLYVYVREKDTVVSIVQTPFLTRSHILAVESSDSSLFYRDVEPLGFINYKDEIPVVLFDPDSILGKASWTKSLINVPDSYKFNGLNIHRERIIWDYNLRNGKFRRNDRESHIIGNGHN